MMTIVNMCLFMIIAFSEVLVQLLGGSERATALGPPVPFTEPLIKILTQLDTSDSQKDPVS